MISRSLLFVSLVAAVSYGGCISVGAQEAPPAGVIFASGASSISEAHGDWTLICGVQNAARTCVITQTLGDQRSGQRVVTIELEAKDGGGTDGTLMMPFGLRLADGVKTQIGGVTVGEVAPFSTCYESGCMAGFSFDRDLTELLKRGKELKLIAIAQDSGENVILTASLSGISTALARSIELMP